MAQTQLNRVYVQSIDGTGLGVNALNIGTKSMTRSITIGGVGTAGVDPNIIVVDTSGVRINSSTTLGGTTTIPNLFATTAIVSGNTSLQNTSTRNLGVTGNATIANASMNKLEVAGHTNLGNTSITNLEVTAGVKFENANLTGTLSVAGLTTLINVNTSSLSVLNNVSIGGNVSVIGNMRSFSLETGNAAVNGTLTVAGKSHLQNTSNSGVLDVVGKTTLGILDVNGQSTLRAGLTVTGAVNVTNTFSASTLSITGETILNNVSLSSLTVTGNTSLNNVSMAGDVDINTFGTGITTIGGASSRTVIANTSINGVVDINLTGTTTTKIGNTLLGSCTVIGNASINGSVDINAKGVYTTTIGNTEIGSRTVIGNTSINGVVDINTSGTTTTTIGNTTLGSCTVIGNTSMNGSVDINAKGTYITTIGNTEVGSRTVIGNTSINGSVDINTSSTGNTTIGSATSSTSVKGDLNVTKILTSGYSPSLYNYAPTLFASVTGGNVSASIGPEYEVTLTAATASVSSISAVSLVANKKYILNFNARTSAGTPTVTILGTQFDLSTTNTLFRKVVTAPTTTSTLGIAISGVATNKIIWSLLTIEPYYDMTLGSDLFSIAGELNVSAATPFTDWDPSRMLFTPTLITVGANPRIAVGRNNTSNVSLFVATCEVTSGNASYITSIDGLNWNQTSLPSITNPRGLVYHENLTQFFMITGEAPPRVFVNTTGNATWTVKTTAQYTIATAFTNMIYGNGNLLAFNATTSDNIIHSTDGNNWTGTANSPHTIPMSITDMAYGKMTDPANGTFIFVACGTNAFYRNHGAQGENSYLKDNWAPATGPQIGNWAFVGFGKNVFIAVSNDATGKVTRSENAGVNWLTPVFLNEALTSRPIYLENTWFIGSNTGLYVSKDDGLTWTKRVGNTLTRSVFSGSFVDIGTSLSLITKRNQRIDGSNTAPDTITLGLEGSTTTAETMVTSKINASAVHATTVNVGTIGYGTSNTVSLAGLVNVSMGIPTTAFTFTPSSVVAQYSRIAYGAGKFVVIGDPGKVFHSSNGTSWTQVTNPTFSGTMKSVVYANDRFMIVTDSSPTNVYTSLNGSAWTQLTYSTGAPNVNLSRCAYGNAVVVAVSSTSTTASVSTNTTGTAWTSLLLPITATGIGFGTMSTGLNRNVFIIVGVNSIRRNQVSPPTTPSDWTTPTTSPSGTWAWAYVGFGNDTFMVTSSDTDGRLTISVDGGKTWSTPISFGIRLRTPFYHGGEWYIGSDSGFMVSKTNGITWEKKSGPDMFEFAYDGSTLVSVNNNVNLTNQINVIGVKKARDDGSTIVSDTIMIGREGSTTTIGSDSLVVSKVNATNASVTNMTVNTMNASTVNVSTIGYGAFNQVSIAGLVNVSMGNPITTFTFTPNSVAAQYSRIAFGNNTFVIIGEPGKVFYSTNGTTWTASTPPSPTFVGALRTVLYTNTFMILTENEPSNVYTSADGITWIKLAPSTNPTSIFHASFGNNSIVGIKQVTGALSVSLTAAGTAWSTAPFTGGLALTGTVFGTMSNTTNGTNMFLIFGTNIIRRNQDATLTDESKWTAPTTTPAGAWAYGGFGNDTFVLTSSDTVGKLTISRDAGKTWSTPIDFGITLRKPIYFDGEWYIGSDSGFMMVSKNNGLSWQKITAPDVFEFASSMVKLVSVNNGPLASNLIHVIGLKKTRDDGSTIISDTITIGREGTTTNIENIVTSKIGYGPSNTLSIASNINVSSGGPVTTLTFTPSTVVAYYGRIAYGNGKFVIIGDALKAFYSTTGTTWTAVTPPSPTFAGAMVTIVFSKDRFMIITDTPNVYTSLDGVTWNTGATIPNIPGQQSASYGNDFTVVVKGNTNLLSVFNNVALTWSTVTLTAGLQFTASVFGKMSTATHGTNVFIIFGKNNVIRRNQDSPAVSGDWALTIPTLPSISGNWTQGGFGNDTFMLVTADVIGLLTISRDAGKTWSTPISFDIKLKAPTYADGEWYIFSDDINSFILISKDNGFTWEKRAGPNAYFAAYGNGIIVTTDSTANLNGTINMMSVKKKRTDGSLITSDSITIGVEGTTTTIGSNSLVVNKIIGTGTSNTIEERLTYTSSFPVTTNSQLAYGNGIFVMTADVDKVYYSTDGTTWTPSTTTITGMVRGLAFGQGKFMAITQGQETNPSKVWTSTDGSTWNAGADAIPRVYNLTFGNGFFVAIADVGATSIAVTTGIGPFTWSNKTVSGATNLIGAGFGAMSNGTNVFLVSGNSTLFRSIDNGSTWQSISSNLTNMGGIRSIAFGNDVFMISSWDWPGRLSISRDAGVNWSQPVQFNCQLSSIAYVEKKWYIGASNANSILTSNDDGVTWRRLEGPSFNISLYANSLFLGTTNDRISVIKFRTTRSDGTNITPDAITIGREGTKATIESDTLTISSQIYVPPATITSEGGLTFSTDQKLIAAAPEIPYTGQRSNKVRIQTFSLSMMDEPSYYNGKNIASGLSQGSNSASQSTNGGVYTYTTGFAALGNINVNSTVVFGQTYKAVITLKSDTPTAATSVQIRNSGNGELLDFGYIGTTYKTYIGYFTPTTTSLLLGVYSNTAVQKTIVVKHFSLEKLDSPNVLDVTGRVSMSGYVGIGTTVPQFPLHVTTTATSPVTFEYIYWFRSGNSGSSAYNNQALADISIYANNYIVCDNIITRSDRRFKTNIVDIEDDRALRDLRLLKPKTYTYMDVVKRGSTPVYGFIAQEVKEVLNYASSYMTETVPNVYQLATFSGDTLTLAFNTSDLSRDPSGVLFPRLKLKTREEKDEFVSILEIIDAHTLRVDKDLTEWGGQLVGDQIVPGNRIFVYGQEVSDFHTLTKDAIWTVATAALQEVDRQLQAEKQKTALMQTALDALLERVNALEQKTSV